MRRALIIGKTTFRRRSAYRLNCVMRWKRSGKTCWTLKNTWAHNMNKIEIPCVDVGQDSSAWSTRIDQNSFPLERLCRNTVHGSRASPRTVLPDCDIKHLPVRPELVEGFRASCDTLSD